MVVIVIVFGLIGASAATTAWWVAEQVPRTNVDGLAATSQPLHILVVGNDSRAGLSDEERRELSTGHAEGERADTLFVMTIDGDRTALLALPRDLLVQRCDGTAGRINSAIAIGDGPGCLVRTVTSLSGLPLHHYLEITFGGLRDAVDAVGGVSLCLEAAIADRDAGINLPAGCQRLDGADALGYVRVRKIDDDFQRIQRQQQFVGALASELVSQASPLRPVHTVRVAADVARSVTADQHLGPVTMARVAWALRAVAGGELITDTVPVTPRTTRQGAAVLDLVTDEAAILFSAHRTGTIFTMDAP